MVKSVNKINKAKYKKSVNNKIYAIAGIIIIVIIGLTVFFGTGSNSGSNAIAGPAPSGNVCSENVAYLQVGVDKYGELTGQMPTDVNQLTQTKDGKPFVEKVPACPSGNLYVIENGLVKEVPRQ